MQACTSNTKVVLSFPLEKFVMSTFFIRKFVVSTFVIRNFVMFAFFIRKLSSVSLFPLDIRTLVVSLAISRYMVI